MKKMKTQDFVHDEKRLAYLLRHDRDYPLSPNGWRDIGDLVEHHGFSNEQLLEIVAKSNKRRFEVSGDGCKIRALQGHSVDVDMHYENTMPPDLLFHGTSNSNLESIMAEGIRRMTRQYVQLSSDCSTAEMVGRRKGGSCVVLEVDSRRMSADGISFYVSKNGVWLVESVPPQYVRVVS